MFAFGDETFGDDRSTENKTPSKIHPIEIETPPIAETVAASDLTAPRTIEAQI
jgi:hypothetical protein